MANKFVARKGLVALANSEFTGSINVSSDLTVKGSVSGSFTGSLQGTADSSSYVSFTNIDNKPTLLSGSEQIASDISGSVIDLSSSLELRIANNEATGSDLVSRIETYEVVNVVSSSLQIASDISGSFTDLSSSLELRVAKNEATASDHENRLLIYETSSIVSSSAQIASDISGSFTGLSSSLEVRIANNEATGSDHESRILVFETSSVVSGSAQIASDISGSFVNISSSLEQRITAQEGFSSSLDTTELTLSGSFSGSFVGDGSQLSGVTSYTDSDTLSYINTVGVISSSLQIASDISGSFTDVSGSLSGRVVLLESTASNHENRLLVFETSSIVSGSQQIADDISGSLGTNATLIRSLTAAGISGSFTSASDALYSTVNTKLGVADTGSFAKTDVDNSFGGTQYFNNVDVNGTASFGFIQSVTGSATIIGDQYVVVNAAVDGARFAGIQVYDSESGIQHTASLAWDSLTNKWVYSNPSGSYHGGALLSGPRNTGSLGDETFPTYNYILRGQGGDHVYDSNIIDNDTAVKIGINAEITGSLIVSSGITGTLTGNASTSTSASYASNASTADSATAASTATSASYASNASTADLATAASSATSATSATSASYASNASTADLATAASTATSASYASNASTADSATAASTATSASHADAAPYSGLHGTVPTWNQSTTGNAATATSASHAGATPYSGLYGTVPTWNQNTTGNAATATSASYATTAGSAGTAASATSASYSSTASALDGVGVGSFLRSDAEDTSTAMKVMYTSLTDNEDWINSPISILERGNVGTAQSADKYGPNINLHWTSRWSKSLWGNSSGVLTWGEYNASGVPQADGTFRAGNFLVGSNNYQVLHSNNFTSYTDPKYLRADTEDTTTGHIIIDSDWNNGSTYVEQFTIYGTFPSMAFRSTNADSNTGGTWLIHMEGDGDLTWYSSTDGPTDNWTKRMELQQGGVLQINGQTVWHTGNDGAGSGLNADLLDGYQETSFVRLAVNSSSPTNGNFAIGSASSRNFIQSHAGQPLDINPLGNAVTIGGASNTAWHAGNDGAGSGLDADTVDGIQASAFALATTSGTQVSLDTYVASSGTWTFSNNNSEWGNPKFDHTYNQFLYGDASAYLEYNVPAGMKSAYISQLQWSSGGYIDVHGVQSGGQLVFLRRINTKQTVENSDEGTNHDGSTVTFLASGLEHYSKIRITVQSGRLHLTGLAFNANENIGTEGTGMVHGAQLVPGNVNADTLDGYDSTTFIGQLGNSYYQANTWIQLNGAYGLYAPNNNGAHLYPNNGTYGAWRVVGTRNSYNGIEFDASNGNVVVMVRNDSQVTGFHNNTHGWQLYWNAGTGYVGKGSYGGSDATILDSSNYTTYTVTKTGSGASGTWGISISGTAADANNLGGQSAASHYNFYKLTGFSVGGNTSTWYPVEFSGDYWGSGPVELELLRTSVHQDGSSYGYMHTKIFGHSTAWGHHTDFWEWETNITNGTYGGMFNGVSGNPCSNSFVVYLRGGLSYFHKSNAGTTCSIVQNTAGNITVSPCNNAFNTKSSLDSNVANNSKYFQTNLNPKSNNGANLGSGDTKWNAIYATTGYFYGDVYAYYSSDERLKTNITSISNAVNKVKQIGGYNFDWIADSNIHTNTGNDIGVIAQEIENVLPEAVTTRENGYKAVRYEKIVPLLIEAIKEQQLTIESLEKRIEDLENK